MTETISTAQAAQILKVTQRTIQRMIQNGKLDAAPINKDAQRMIYLVTRASIEAFRRKKK